MQSTKYFCCSPLTGTGILILLANSKIKVFLKEKNTHILDIHYEIIFLISITNYSHILDIDIPDIQKTNKRFTEN